MDQGWEDHVHSQQWGTNVTAEGHSQILSTFSRGLSSTHEKRSFVLKSVHQSGKFLDMPAQNSELGKFPWEMSQR